MSFFFLEQSMGLALQHLLGCVILTDVLSEKKEKELIKETSSEQIIRPNFHIPEGGKVDSSLSPL